MAFSDWLAIWYVCGTGIEAGLLIKSYKNKELNAWNNI